jgi:hypothetical protein
MLKFRRRKNPFVTLRAENVEVGDRFVFDNYAVEVLAVLLDDEEVHLIFGTTHPGADPRTRRTASINRNLWMTVARY